MVRVSMASRRRSPRAAICSIFLLAGGCVADDYGPRAVTYNVDANAARSNLSLLNIVRAAHRKPLQFTEVTSVTGTASASGTLGAMVPVIGTGSILSPSATVSGGPSFSVSSLSTQEFYEASTAPIDAQTIGILLNQGFRPEVVFSLVMSEIQLTDKKGAIRYRLDVDNQRQFYSSYYAVLELVRNGLTVVRKAKEKEIGPELTPAEAKQASLALLRSTDPSKQPSLTPSKDAQGYKLSSASNEYVVCFDRSRDQRITPLFNKDSNIYRTPAAKAKSIPLTLVKGRPAFQINLSSAYRCGSKEASTNSSVDLRYTPRSLQGIYEYLGSLTRIELGLEHPAASLDIPGEPGEPPFVLFDMRAGAPGSQDARTEYGGQTYYVSTDPSGGNASDEVLAILAVLQALNSKATTLPAPVTTSILVR